jgi:hypothetical protein
VSASDALSTLVKLAVVSLVVGLLLRFFDITPARLLESFGETVRDIFTLAVDAVSWAVPYILIGAVVVVPIWVVMTILRVSKKRSS